MFSGEHYHNMDTKGRLIIPSRLRATLEDNFIDKFYVTRGFDKCLFVYDENEWNTLEQKFKNLPITGKDAAKVRAFVRIFYSGAWAVNCDKQGRINIPQNLLDYASINSEVAIIGASNRIELWDSKTWNDYRALSIDSYEELAESIDDLGI